MNTMMHDAAVKAGRSILATRMLAAAAAVAALAPLAIAQTAWRLVDLGTVYGESHAFSLSGDPGSILAAGSSTAADAHFRGVLYDSGAGALAQLAGYPEAVAFDVKPDGTVVGTAYKLGVIAPEAFKISGGVLVDLGAFAARDVNGAGVIAGTTTYTTTTFGGIQLPRACRWTAGVLTSLPALGGQSSQAFAIDDLGRVGGSAFNTNDAASRPCLWVGTTAIDLGTLGGSRGQVMALRPDVAVGLSETSAGLMHATRWNITAAGAVLSRVDLGSLSAALSSAAHAVNASGDVVGVSGFHAVLWRNGQIIDLNTLHSDSSWVLENAWDIDDRGRIAGTGSQWGYPRAFVLEPCFADFDGSGFVDFDDFNQFVVAFEAGDMAADFDGSGFVDFDDFNAFVVAFETGC